MEQHVQPGPEHGSDERSDQEQPYLAERLTGRDDGRPKAAGRVDRGAVNRDPDDVCHREGEAHDQAGHGHAGRLHRRGEHNQHERAGQDDLDQERTADRSSQQREVVVTIGAKPDPGLDVERRAVQDPQQQQRADDGANHLRDPVRNRVHDGHPPREPGPEGHCRVYVAPRDRPDRRDQRDEDQAEREPGDQDPGGDAAAEGPEAETDRGYAASEEDQQGRAHQLGGRLPGQHGIDRYRVIGHPRLAGPGRGS
jgi:hypothetical protein